MRRSLENVPAYLAGKPAAAVPGLTSFKVSSNENPYSPLPEVVAALSFEQINRYPDFSNTRLRELLAERYNLASENFATGTGSVGVLQQIVQANPAIVTPPAPSPSATTPPVNTTPGDGH